MADIITYPENGITYDADDASGYLATRLSGVYSAEEDFSVTAQGGLSVQVSAGQAWVRPARFKGRSIIMEQPTTVVLTEADPVRSRIDRIVLRYDAAAKKTSLQVLEGVPNSAGPAAPAITRTELIDPVPLGAIRKGIARTLEQVDGFIFGQVQAHRKGQHRFLFGVVVAIALNFGEMLPGDVGLLVHGGVFQPPLVNEPQ